MSYADRLHAAVQEKRSPVVVGLDPHLERLPDEFTAAHDPDASAAEVASDVERFLGEVIDAVHEHVPAVKPQSAFFEQLGAAGVAAWERTVARARDAGLLVIGDVKRGDIGSTAAAYARAFLTGGPGADPRSLCDAITVNPYLGSDSVAPFLGACREGGTGLYVLVRTSNPSSAELQAPGDPPLMHRVATLVDGWGADLIGAAGLSSVGAVVGATHRRELADLRARMPRTPLLVPGYGAQGAGPADVRAAFTEGLRGALIASSRAVLFAGAERPEVPWKDACRDAAVAMTEDLRAAVG